jgi:transposase
LLFADEAEASTHPYLARVWAKRGADLRVPAPGQAHKRALFGARVHGSGELIVQTSPTKNSVAFCRFLEHLKARAEHKPLHLVLDNGPIHKSRMSRAALAAAADWLTIEWLPAYAPELNDIERDWRNMKCHYLAHQTFTDIDSLDWHIRASVIAINKQRLHRSCAGP